MMQRYSTDYLVHDVIFSKTLFWVQVHDIPIRFMTKEVVENICDIVGEVQKSAGAITDEGGHFIWVRVMIDITLPLCRGMVITLENRSKHWSKGTLKVEQQQYNSTLKAAPYTSSGRDVIVAETNQANLVTNEGVIPVININELPVANEPAINAMLLPNEDIDSIPPMAVTVLTEANNNGELKTKEQELIPDSITPENLFDIQIK
ncbi:hypothetical protein CFP56_039195 [Quercus suber]|uniref:DUF4283 domain-containing protein n=1 Tax=Quercus suber TaxID=58331 RepID=A0AAW0J1H0_QUESU